MSDPILALTDLTKTYDSFVAVDQVSLELSKGEFLSFLGPSGSGKTTTLSMIAGLTRPTSGHIHLEGQPIDPLPPYRRNIGLVFQNYALFPHMSVARNIAFPLEMRKVPRAEIERRVADALALVGLPDRGGRLPRQLSGGQQQRVALARALVFEPKLLLMDEPLGALDKQLREQMQLEIKRLHHELGMSIIYVTHDQEEALVMSDRIAVFNHGRLEQIGPSSTLYERPATRFVAGFVGESNFLDGTVREVGDGFCRVDWRGTTLRARPGGGFVPGEAVTVSIRPEWLHLRAADATPPAPENAVAGRIAEMVYMGKTCRYVVDLANGARGNVLRQVTSAEDYPFAVGDAVVLEWKAESAMALPGGPGEDA